MENGLADAIRLTAWLEAATAHRDAANRYDRHLRSCSFCSPSAGAGCDAGRGLRETMYTAADAHADVHAAAFEHAIADCSCLGDLAKNCRPRPAAVSSSDGGVVRVLRPAGSVLPGQRAPVSPAPRREGRADAR